MIGHVQDSAVGGRRGEAGQPLGTDRSGGERQWIYLRAIWEEEAEVFVGAATATVMVTSMEATTIMDGGWEDPPAKRGIDQYQGQDTPGAAAGRGLGVLPPQECQ